MRLCENHCSPITSYFSFKCSTLLSKSMQLIRPNTLLYTGTLCSQTQKKKNACLVGKCSSLHIIQAANTSTQLCCNYTSVVTTAEIRDAEKHTVNAVHFPSHELHPHTLHLPGTFRNVTPYTYPHEQDGDTQRMAPPYICLSLFLSLTAEMDKSWSICA